MIGHNKENHILIKLFVLLVNLKTNLISLVGFESKKEKFLLEALREIAGYQSVTKYKSKELLKVKDLAAQKLKEYYDNR